MSTQATLGEVAYAAYGRTTDHKNYQGLPMPVWTDLGDTIQQAWENAAKAIQGATSSPMVVAAAHVRVNYADAWTELTGYVSEAIADGGTINPSDMLGYMRELKTRAAAPMRDWMRSTDGDAS